jgi:hypothetical protein
MAQRFERGFRSLGPTTATGADLLQRLKDGADGALEFVHAMIMTKAVRHGKRRGWQAERLPYNAA